MIQTEPKSYAMLVNGQWVGASNGETFDSVNPADTSDVVARFPAAAEEDAIRAIRAAEAAYPGWASTAPSQRADILKRAAALLESRVDQYSEELTREEGKILGAAKLEVKRAAATLRFYAEEGISFSGETFSSDDPNAIVYTIREPLGVVSVITPWNFPLSIPSRKIAPALITGNTVVFKPASDTPLIALRLVECLVEAGIPDGVINLVTGPASRVGTPLTTDPAVRAITFTGSTQAGRSIHRMASLTTRTQMELGGKNPLIVMEDADLDKAVDLTIRGGLELTGQACTGTSRVLVMDSVHDAFVERLLEKTKKLVIGNGLHPGVEIGPLANRSQLETVLDYVRIGQEEGATLLYGGEHLVEGEWARVHVKPDMRIAQEEIFGPVIAVIRVSGFDEAIEVANGVEYGLSASIVTRDIEKAMRFVQRIQSGTVKINRTTTGNLIHAPFGGLKNSSTSTFRESGRVGLEFFTQLKTVYFGF
jgi:acyl-CoA reductase-like NAD-dependent aldehyde dehydrogenase